jgi:hypothetical protein
MLLLQQEGLERGQRSFKIGTIKEIFIKRALKQQFEI